MKWYAASAIMYFRRKRATRQREFLVWENVYLVRASSIREAKKKARHFALAASGNDGAS